MKRLLPIHIVLIGCLLISGCAGVHNSLRPSGKSSHWNLFNRNTAARKDSKKKRKELPLENMVVIWKDTVLEKEGAPAISGFGGRIYFHDSDNQAVKAEGELIVYGFDDSVTDTGRSRKPAKKFVFSNEQFQTHFSKSDLGDSYSVWIPWEEAGGNQKNISLVAIFKTTEGKVINAGSSNNVLPGKKPENDGVVVMSSKGPKAKEQGSIGQASYSSGPIEVGQAQQAMLNEEVTSKSRILSNTIELTPSMASLFSTPATQSSNVTPKSEQKTKPAQPALNTFRPGQNRAKTTENQSEKPNSVESDGLEKSETKPKPAPVFGVPGAFK